MISPEERAALLLMDVDGIEGEIKKRQETMVQLVGNLYPRIIADEIAELRKIKDAKNAGG